MSALFDRFSAISMRWKLQLSFFLVTMITIIINRWVGYGEIEYLIEIARQHQVDPAVIQLLEQRLTIYIQDSLWQSAIEFIVLFILIGVLSGFLVRPILALCEALDCVEHGDLTREVEITSGDEVGILERRFNAMRIHLNEIMQSLDSSSKQMTNSAFQVSAISHEISEVEAREHERTSEVMNAMHDLQDTLASVNHMAIEASDRSTGTEEKARNSITKVSSSISTMENMATEIDTAASQMSELNQSAKQITTVVNSIHDIAEQTNLLALNAAIEAARAGEQGRGFAVVADEVRGLANRTTQSTTQISEIIDQLYDNVTRVSESMNLVVESAATTQKNSREIGHVMEDMANDVSGTAQSNLNIASVSSEQTQRLHELQQSLQRLFEINKENHAKVETTAGISDDLYHVTEKLQGVLSEFTFDATPVPQPFAGSEERRAPRIDYRLRVEVSQNNVVHGGSCIDFSLTGMKLRLSEKLDQSAPFKLQVYVPYDNYSDYDQQNPLTVNARIVWQNQEGQYAMHGIEYIDLDSRAKQLLERCVTHFNSKAA